MALLIVDYQRLLGSAPSGNGPPGCLSYDLDEMEPSFLRVSYFGRMREWQVLITTEI